jgi:pimeloyl-ACP methyl ester carboxylesterase
MWDLGRRMQVGADEVAWDVLGDGPPVVLVHGFPSHSFIWRDVAARLARTRRVHVLDLIGFGQSAQRPGQVLFGRPQAEAIAALVDAAGGAGTDLVAHDIGAAFSLEAVLDGLAAPRRLVLVSAAVLTPCVSGASEHVRRYMEAYETMPGAIYRRIVSGHVPTTMATPMSDDVLERYLRPWTGAAGQAAYLAFLGQLDDAYLDGIRDRLRELRVPTRVVWGAADTWIDPGSAGRIAALVPGADVRMVPGAGHFAMEDDAAGVTDAIEDFLDR